MATLHRDLEPWSYSMAACQPISLLSEYFVLFYKSQYLIDNTLYGIKTKLIVIMIQIITINHIISANEIFVEHFLHP